MRHAHHRDGFDPEASREASREASSPASTPGNDAIPPLTADEPGLDAFRLTCPSCDADLAIDELFASHRVCGSCHRHFAIPARERLALLIDSGTFDAFVLDRSPMTPDSDQAAANAVGHLAEHHDLAAIEDAVVAGTARIGGTEVVVAVLDDHLVGNVLGALLAGKIMFAFEHGWTRRLPVVVACAGGGARAGLTRDPGALAPVQASRLAASAAQLRLAGVPLVSILTHPMSAAIYAAIPAHSDVVLAEPSVRLAAFAPTLGEDRPAVAEDDPLGDGWIDAVVDRVRLRSTVGTLLDLLTARGMPATTSAAPLESHQPGPSIRNALAHVHHADRPDSAGYLAAIVPSLFELRGDRVRGDDRGVVGGIGRIDALTVMAARSATAGDEAIAVRKLARLARLAGRLELPLVLLVDGPGGGAAPEASIEACQAVARLAEVLSMIPVPVICVGTGEIRGLAAQAMMSGDRTYMQENAVSITGFDGLAAIDPTSAGAGPWRPGGGTVLTAHECLRLGLIDGVIPEPVPGAHADPAAATAMLVTAVRTALADLAGVGQRRLLDTRHRRLRTIGQSTPEGQAAVRRELREFQEWQKTLARSIEGWRERWELRGGSFRLSFGRPDLGELAQRFRARRVDHTDRADHTEQADQHESTIDR